MTKDTSHKKVEANRRNALRSTGPKTTEGKRAVRHNAVKHGILTKDIVVNVFDGAEDKEEFDELLQRLKDDLQPYGILEQAQVERIAICYWRLRRAIRAESGDLGKQLNFIKLEKAFQNKQTIRPHGQMLRDLTVIRIICRRHRWA